MGKGLCFVRPTHGRFIVKPSFANLARIAPALALLCCAAPKAIVVGPPPAAPKKEQPEELKPPGPPIEPPTEDGIRLPDMLGMPGDGEFRATAPGATQSPANPGAVIARPPTDPPPRPKPKEGE